MGIYDYNTGSIAIAGNSIFSSLNSNRGTIIVRNNCKISECNDNRGSIEFQHGLVIETINNNSGSVSVADWSKVGLIANNRGSIILAPDCVLMNTENNLGSIVGGKQGVPNIASVEAHSRKYSSHYNDRTIFNPSFVNAGESSDSMGLRTLLNQPILGSFQPSKSKSASSNDADQALCAICLEGPKNVAFQCGHLCCANCSKKLQTCHMCRVKIDQKIKLFL